MKKILGLDLGTNSIGWALINLDEEEKKGNIIDAGSRIIPMSQDVLGKFDSGQSISQTAERTGYRGVRRLRERHLLRRERLHRVLNILDFLPEHYAQQIDFEKRLGQFIPDTEPKINYRFNEETKQFEFIFKKSFVEMMEDFQKQVPAFVNDDRKVPYDWTIYYLRKKALKERIEKEELAWLLLNFNQKRGYYQLRGEDEEEVQNKLVEFYSLRVVDVVDSGDKKKDEVWYNVHLENGWIYRRTSKTPLDWVGKTKEFIVTTDLNEDGTVKTDKEGKEKRSFRAPAETDWTLMKKKTEADIERTGKTVGTYIYDALLDNPTQKIKGKLVRVVERKFYKQELEAILAVQKQFHPELQDENLYKSCLEELYEFNEAHKASIAVKDFIHLFVNDIIFYQRPLKSKKSLISNCKFESRTFVKDGIKETNPLKCIAKSHPLFQEFRLLQFIQNLKIYQKEKLVADKLYNDVDVTNELLPTTEHWINLFEWLNERKEIDHKALLGFILKPLKLKTTHYRWNYVYDPIKDESKSYPCNETRAMIKSRLSKVGSVKDDFLSKDNEEALWHILYSVEDKHDIKKALTTFAGKHDLDGEFIVQFQKFPPFKKEYSSYSAKAIKKLLPLMRFGKYWNEEAIHEQTKDRINKLLNGEYDKQIRDRVRDKAINLNTVYDFQDLPLWLASYIVYDRHSEDADALKWQTPGDIESYLKNEFKQHSLRNPIVEQVITETLRVVKDIWKVYGKSEENFFNEIHIELGREMKNPADKRRDMTNKINENENTNLRMKALLAEMLTDSEYESVRPYSPGQQEILKIYEEGVLNAADEIPEEILKISRQAQPTQSELIKYKLWLQQGYRSPYTGNIIPLNKLFTRAYDIEHIIPQSRFFDDSFSNKVICEAEINSDKDNSTAYEYIRENSGKKIELSHGQSVTLFTIDAYEEHVKRNYAKVPGKKRKLLMDEIPEAFIQRQMNDSRYISRVVKNLMSNIVREQGEQEAISKNVLATNGAITNTLKQDWGLNDVWNDVITPRFERLNELTNSKNFGDWTIKEGKRVFQTQVPLELQKGFSKKRIDHRHHALDAIVIACATRSHINYLNNENANGNDKSKPKRFDLRNKLRRLEDVQVERFENGEKVKKVIKVGKEFYKPWETFTQEVKESLYTIVVSFKQNLRVINKTTNKHYTWKTKDGAVGKELITQHKGESWAIRKPMHKDTVSGLVKLRFKKIVSLSNAIEDVENIVLRDLRLHIHQLLNNNLDKKKILAHFKELNNHWNGQEVSKIEIYYLDVDKDGTPANAASRVKIDESFYSSKIASITDGSIQKIMLAHLKKYDEDKNGKVVEHPELAFSSDGLDEMNKDIRNLNGGKNYQPILKVRTYEPKGNKFSVGETGNKKDKYVEAAKGTNLYFGIYVNEEGKRSYETVPFNIVVERLKQKLSPVPEVNEDGYTRLAFVSPNDLVYIPIPDEQNTLAPIDPTKFSKEQLQRIYKVVKFTGSRLYAIPYFVATSIVDKVEFMQGNCLEFSLDTNKQSIKQSLIKLNVDRIGQLQLFKKVQIDFLQPFKTRVSDYKVDELNPAPEV